MEIDTKEPKAILCCSATPYHFTLKALAFTGFTVPLKHARAQAKDPTSSQNNGQLGAAIFTLCTFPRRQHLSTQKYKHWEIVCFPRSSLLSLHARWFLSLRFHLTGKE